MCGLMGVSRLGTEISLDMNSILFGRGVRGIIEGDSVPDEFIPRLVDLHAQGRFPFDRLVTPFRFDEIQKAVDASEGGRVVKAVLRMSVDDLPKTSTGEILRRVLAESAI